MTTLHLRLGDCVVRMAEMPEGSIGAIVSDPPYGLRFMGEEFDDLGDGSAQRAWHRPWLTEAFRVLRPGGTIKAFGGTRTFHHLAATMRSVGFTGVGLEAWSYGSGFPKSLNIGKAIDRAAGAEQTVGSVKIRPDGTTRSADQWSSGMGYHGANASPRVETMPATDAARAWEGWGTALKPSWEPVLVGRKPE